MDYFAGLDISMDETHVCVLDREGAVVRESKAASTAEAIAGELSKAPSCRRIVFETGRMAPMLFHGLNQLGLPAVCVESRQAYQALKSLATYKTDRNDARECPARWNRGGRRELTCGRPRGSFLVRGAARRAAAWVLSRNTRSFLRWLSRSSIALRPTALRTSLNSNGLMTSTSSSTSPSRPQSGKWAFPQSSNCPTDEGDRRMALVLGGSSGWPPCAICARGARKTGSGRDASRAGGCPGFECWVVGHENSERGHLPGLAFPRVRSRHA